MCFSLNNITRTTNFTGIIVCEIETFYTGLSLSKARLVLRQDRALILDNKDITSSLRKHPFPLTLRRWGRFKPWGRGRGGYSREFWIAVCREGSRTLNLFKD